MKDDFDTHNHNMDKYIKNGVCYMAKYISVRGWIECDNIQIHTIKRIISNYELRVDFGSIIDYESIKLYNKGWCYPKEIINWTTCIFYGADVKEYCLDFIKNEIKEILKEIEEIEGMFILKYEEGERRCWKIVDAQIIEKIIN